ncbi:hypothetical protein EKO04_001580 [Ascochyta lentis]|uniref:Fe2OG dioxygenase domain-containing protein n=1 Tax=Ascochyta lentis TaxID=205686 RepID=A0A8H7ML00_9PLEO|nr:hypothetical protein EKO04_001580 [Ascochyta lentis]
MVIGLQNDFITPTGHLPVDTTSGFLDRIHELIPKFRELNGHIIWVQTLYEADRLANTSSTGEGDALVIAGLVDGEENSSQAGDDESTKDLVLPVPQAQSRSAKHKQRALDLFKRVSSRRKALPAEEAKVIVEEDEELFLLKRAKRSAACMPDTDGAQFTEGIKNLIETPRDAVISTTNYSAFLGTNLLLTLRARLVTEIYVCGCLTNVSILATVIDGARHGIKINVVQDALGFRKEIRHDLALKRMEHFFDAWLVTSADILAMEQLTIVEPTKEEAKQDMNNSNQAKDELEALVNKLSLAEKPNTTTKVPEGRVTSATNGQPNTEGTPDSKTPVAAKEANSDDEFAAALARRRRKNDAEQRPADAGATQLIQSKTRMRKKKKKRPTEGSLAEPGVPNIESKRSVIHGTDQPAPATRGEVDSLKTKALDAEAESNGTQRQNRIGEKPLDTKTLDSIVPNKSDLVDSADSSPTKVLPDESNRILSASKPELSTAPLPSASTSGVIPPQTTSTKVESSSPASVETATVTKPSKLKSLANLPVLGPGDYIAEGDSRIVHDLFPPDYYHPSDTSTPLADTIFQQLYSEVRWQKMLHQQGEVPRLVCCQGEFGDGGSKPAYRHPADQTLPLLHFSPKVQRVRRAAEKVIGHPLNHVLIQLYRSGNDYISEHSDKTLDIAKGSSIVNVSFGAQRTMRLRTKRESKAKTAGDDEDTQRETQRVAMPHNSMFVLGPKSNEKWLHGIMADKRIEAERSEPETAYSGARISLTFRHIATFLDTKETTIWGQGATSKDQRGAADVVNDDEAEAERMIRAFSRENHSNEFDWDKWYGDGFDVLHLHEAPEQLPMLFASNNAIQTKQVQLALWEAKVNHTFLEAPNLDNHILQRVHFRDNDAYCTEVSGLAPLLHYIDRYYPICSDKPVTAAANSLLELLSRVPEFFLDRTANSSPAQPEAETRDFTAALHALNEQLKDHGGPFIAGQRFSIADCVVWPVLDDRVEKWANWNELDWPELAEYYRLTWKKKACLKKLRGELSADGKKA